MASNSYTADFLSWWKDLWVSTNGMNPSQEAKAAAWAGWHAGRAREAEVWNTRPPGPNDGQNAAPHGKPTGHTGNGPGTGLPADAAPHQMVRVPLAEAKRMESFLWCYVGENAIEAHQLSDKLQKHIEASPSATNNEGKT